MKPFSKVEADSAAAVLVVEDEPLIRGMAADSFADAGYRVFEAPDAAEAIAILDKNDDICAVFTDIEMPGDMNGLALAAMIRGRWPAIAVLVTSGRVIPGESSIPAGADFLPKPYRQSEMIRRVAALMVPGRFE